MRRGGDATRGTQKHPTQRSTTNLEKSTGCKLARGSTFTEPTQSNRTAGSEMLQQNSVLITNSDRSC